MTAQQRTNAPVIGGIFIAVSGCILIAFTLAAAYYALLPAVYFTSYAIVLTVTLSRYMAGFLLATVAIVGGILSMLRRNYVLAFVGAAFVLAFSIDNLSGNFGQLLFVPAEDWPRLTSWLFILLIEMVALALSLLGLILIAKSRAEFS